jgi:hypothetical protein
MTVMVIYDGDDGDLVMAWVTVMVTVMVIW